MKYDVEKIFDDVAYLSKIHSKKDYEKWMGVFNEKRYPLLAELIKSEDVAAEAGTFCEEVTASFKKFGKVRGADLMNLNYYMIYYVFPAIQMNEEKDDAIRICDSLRDVWNSHFKSNINYTDYDTLMEGFQTKIFGIPIGKN